MINCIFLFNLKFKMCIYCNYNICIFFFNFRKPGHRSITIQMDKKKVNNKACSIEVSVASNDIIEKICDNVPITKQMYDELLPNPMKPYRRMAGK